LRHEKQRAGQGVNQRAGRSSHQRVTQNQCPNKEKKKNEGDEKQKQTKEHGPRQVRRAEKDLRLVVGIGRKLDENPRISSRTMEMMKEQRRRRVGKEVSRTMKEEKTES
jgi:hypothetical protein